AIQAMATGATLRFIEHRAELVERHAGVHSAGFEPLLIAGLVVDIKRSTHVGVAAAAIFGTFKMMFAERCRVKPDLGIAIRQNVVLYTHVGDEEIVNNVL